MALSGCREYLLLVLLVQRIHEVDERPEISIGFLAQGIALVLLPLVLGLLPGHLPLGRVLVHRSVEAACELAVPRHCHHHVLVADVSPDVIFVL
eukprot:3512652-Pyramimonas_sp.AAC.1